MKSFAMLFSALVGVILTACIQASIHDDAKTTSPRASEDDEIVKSKHRRDVSDQDNNDGLGLTRDIFQSFLNPYIRRQQRALPFGNGDVLDSEFGGGGGGGGASPREVDELERERQTMLAIDENEKIQSAIRQLILELLKHIRTTKKIKSSLSKRQRWASIGTKLKPGRRKSNRRTQSPMRYGRSVSRPGTLF